MLYDNTSIESIIAYAKILEGKTFIEVLASNVEDEKDFELYLEKYGNPKRKGGLGNFLEEVYFKYKANSDSKADFYDAGVELKVSPYEINKRNEYRAGERLVLTMIDYNNPVEEDIFKSHLWDKIAKILLIYYLRDCELLKNLEYRIGYVGLFSPNKSDLQIIKGDYEKIVTKVKAGKAHELSESDTIYLSACTKGATAEKSVANQYYNKEIKAKKRAFAFKQSYMHSVLNCMIDSSNNKTENIIKTTDELHDTTFEEAVLAKLIPYYNRSDDDLCAIFNRDYNNNKSQWSDLAYRMLGIKSNKASEFLKANIVVKAVRVETNGKTKENISFPAFKFKDLIKEKWENSTVFRYFNETKFLFVIYNKSGNKYIFKSAKFWNMPLTDLENDVQCCWQATVNKIKEGVNLIEDRGRILNDLPAIKDNKIMHVRPHATCRAYKLKCGKIFGNLNRDANELPDGQWMTNQSFWLNNSYVISKIIK